MEKGGGNTVLVNFSTIHVEHSWEQHIFMDTICDEDTGDQYNNELLDNISAEELTTNTPPDANRMLMNMSTLLPWGTSLKPPSYCHSYPEPRDSDGDGANSTSLAFISVITRWVFRDNGDRKCQWVSLRMNPQAHGIPL